MKRVEHNEEHWVFPFVEYAPDKAGGKLPLILQLHGAGERGLGGEQLSKVDVNGFSQLWKTGEYSCLAILPQCPADSFWAARVESILKFLDQILAHYDVDESRIYLTGMSMGGYGTWFTAMAAPERFAAIAPICGGGMAWNAGVLNMPVWTFHGTQDPLVSLHQTEEMVAALENCGGNVRYTRMEGVGHDVWVDACREPLLNWLLEQKKRR